MDRSAGLPEPEIASSERRIASLVEQMRWLQTCNDPECLGLCEECATPRGGVGAAGAAGDDHHALEEGSELTRAPMIRLSEELTYWT